MYAEFVNPFRDQSDWLHVDDARVICLPFIDRRGLGYPSNRDKHLLQGEFVIPKVCS